MCAFWIATWLNEIPLQSFICGGTAREKRKMMACKTAKDRNLVHVLFLVDLDRNSHQMPLPNCSFSRLQLSDEVLGDSCHLLWAHWVPALSPCSLLSAFSLWEPRVAGSTAGVYHYICVHYRLLALCAVTCTWYLLLFPQVACYCLGWM